MYTLEIYRKTDIILYEKNYFQFFNFEHISFIFVSFIFKELASVTFFDTRNIVFIKYNGKYKNMNIWENQPFIMYPNRKYYLQVKIYC